MKLTTIRINNARFYSYRGVLEHEKKFGNVYEVDVEMQCDLGNLSISDDLSKTVDYLSVYGLVKRIFESEKFNLIESLNKKICKEIIDNFTPVKIVKVSVRKLIASLGIIDSVEVVHTEER